MLNSSRTILTTRIVIVQTMFFIALAGCRFNSPSVDESKIVPAAQFVIGSTLLNTAPVAHNPRQQAALYRELQSATGLSSSDALEVLGAIRDDPETTKKLYDTMQQIITQRPDTAVHHK